MNALIGCLLTFWLLAAVFLMVFDEIMSNLERIGCFVETLVTLAIKWGER